MSKLIHHNQKRAGEKIAAEFNHNNYVILMAQMQSGKTMSAMSAALSMTHSIERVYIISGDSQTALQDQWQLDINNVRREYPDVNIRWIVSFRHYLDIIPDDIHNSLFIWDESHTSQTQGQSMEAFYKRIGIEINGDQTEMKRRQIYILSISATPISEITCNKNFGQNKPMVFLKTPSAYRGVEYYHTNGLIRQSFPIDNSVNLTNLLKNHMTNGYFIMRIRNSKNFNQEEYIKPLARAIGFKVIVCSSKKSADTNSLTILDTQPDTPTLVLIFGKYRMGQRLEKKYINGVFEYSKSMKADTGLQGLLGRCCGYHEYSFPIYMPENIINRTIPEFLEFINTRGKTSISHAMNTGKALQDGYPMTNRKEIFSNRMSPLSINTNLRLIGYDYYGDIYELA